MHERAQPISRARSFLAKSRHDLLHEKLPQECDEARLLEMVIACQAFGDFFLSHHHKRYAIGE
jgi:hypothetical protein